MGIINSCWDTLLQIAALVHVIDYDAGQQPLRLPSSGLSFPTVHTTGVEFHPQNATRASFTCQYPDLGSEWGPCNSADDRACWLKNTRTGEQYNITTNYDDVFPTGVTREYWLEVEATALTVDGYVKESGFTFNGTYPGPVIEACWGDSLKIHVKNKIQTDGTTIHWHGIRQLGSNQMDGVNGVTQCPTALNDTFTYEFRVQQYGHTWYHSHYRLQYSDGIAGPLTIYGPSSANFDEALQPALITDWTHDSSDDLFQQELHGAIPILDNIVFNGTGAYKCSNLDPKCCATCNRTIGKPGACTPNAHCFDDGANFNGTRFSTAFKKGKRYLLRLINASAESMFIFSIDGHDLEVIATDLVPIKPYKTDSIFIGIGQRYQVIVRAKTDEAELNATGGNYWIRTRVAAGCGSISQDDETTGILNYADFPFNPTPTTVTQQLRTLCEDEPSKNLIPVVPWVLDRSEVVNDINNYTFEAGIENNLSITDSGFARWDLANVPLFLNYSDPTIVHADNINFNFNESYAIVDYNFTTGYVYLVITGQNLSDASHLDKLEIPAAHPIHLHGHDFVVLAQGNKTFNATKDMKDFNYDNPPRRDVALLDSQGYLALAFRPDNPGIWLVHCHIAFHAASGLALQIMERESEIIGALGGEAALDGVKAGCKKWDDWGLEYVQLDSGI